MFITHLLSFVLLVFVVVLVPLFFCSRFYFFIFSPFLVVCSCFSVHHFCTVKIEINTNYKLLFKINQ